MHAGQSFFSKVNKKRHKMSDLDDIINRLLQQGLNDVDSEKEEEVDDNWQKIALSRTG